MTTNTWPVHEYEKAILAMAYFPDLSPQMAVKKLRRWVCNARGLRAQLEATGYRPQARSFTPKQVAMIFDALGEP